jgi:hypothetical protein
MSRYKDYESSSFYHVIDQSDKGWSLCILQLRTTCDRNSFSIAQGIKGDPSYHTITSTEVTANFSKEWELKMCRVVQEIA